MLTKEQVWENATKQHDLEPEDREAFFNQVAVEADTLDDIAGVNLPELISELRKRPKLTAELSRNQVNLWSPDVNDINAQDHHPDWSNWSVEQCDRGFDGVSQHTGSWLLC